MRATRVPIAWFGLGSRRLRTEREVRGWLQRWVDGNAGLADVLGNAWPAGGTGNAGLADATGNAGLADITGNAGLDGAIGNAGLADATGNAGLAGVLGNARLAEASGMKLSGALSKGTGGISERRDWEV